ncbi:MAG TPA: DUF4157 domain-containing protein [Actinomycetota bacterium]|nr:DUF4157 domain-containing protein [Actinomycetota bacterium]
MNLAPPSTKSGPRAPERPRAARTGVQHAARPVVQHAARPVVQRACSCSGRSDEPCDCAAAPSLLQRACSCGAGSAPAPGAGGSCGCAGAPGAGGAHDFSKVRVHDGGPGLDVSSPGDALERNAEAVARSVLAGPAPARPHPASAPATAARAATPPAPARGPLSGSLGSGAPLPASERSFFEPRLGRDLSDVRVHTGDDAAASAERLGARAYTVASDVVFAPGEYRPGTASGRALLAHELVHVAQQTGGAARVARAPTMVQRACPATPCPPVAVPVTALNPIWRQAEICIQDTYAVTHPGSRRGVSLAFNLDWTFLSGANPREREALACLRGNFTAKSGMFAGEPDIWDFANGTMYEITTPSGAPFRRGKLAAEVSLANSLTAPMECGGMLFGAGTWTPPSPCYWIGGDLYISVVNDAGVLTYQVIKDTAKEAALAVLLAMLAAAAKKGGPQAGAKTVGAKAAGRAAPAYAIASLVATAILLGSGRAEAKAGPGDKEPLVQLFEALAQSGTPVPPEVQKMIEDNPELKAKIEKAMSKGGDPTAAQKEINDEILKIIAANKDQFSDEDLETLAGLTEVGQGRLPQGKQTAETVRKMLDDRRAGKTGGAGDGKGTGEGKGTAEGKPAEKTDKTDTPPDKTPGGTSGAPGGGAKVTLSEETRTRIAGAPAPIRKLWDAITKGTGEGPSVTDATAQRFLSEIPSDLTDAQVQALITRLGPATGKSFDDIMTSLKEGIAELRKSPADASKGGGAQAQAPAPSVAPADAVPSDEAIAKLAAIAAKIPPGAYKPGEYVLTWDEEKAGLIDGTVRGITNDGKGLAGQVTVRIDARSADGKTLTVTYLASSILVDAQRRVFPVAGRTTTLQLLSKKK